MAVTEVDEAGERFSEAIRAAIVEYLDWIETRLSVLENIAASHGDDPRDYLPQHKHDGSRFH